MVQTIHDHLAGVRAATQLVKYTAKFWGQSHLAGARGQANAVRASMSDAANCLVEADAWLRWMEEEASDPDVDEQMQRIRHNLHLTWGRRALKDATAYALALLRLNKAIGDFGGYGRLGAATKASSGPALATFDRFADPEGKQQFDPSY